LRGANASQLKDAYQAGRNAVNQNRKSQQSSAIIIAVGVGVVVIVGPYLSQNIWYNVLAIAAWALFVAALSYWWAKRNSR
jgi:Flp pilus assembly protein TadB